MSRLNFLLTLLSLNAVLVIIERLSPTTKIILQPYNFLRVHEVFQMTVVITISIVISFLLLKVITRDFETLKSKSETVLGIIFILGIYFTATGNGLHEVASFLFNTFCNTKIIQTKLCGSMFFDDYYFGNIVYFIGLFLSNIALILLEYKSILKKASKNQTIITVLNGALYGLALFAYAAFDLVLVGLYFVAISSITVMAIILIKKTRLSLTPFTLYSISAYLLAMVLTLLVRLH